MYTLQVGKPAPFFKLKALVNDKFEEISLDDFKDRWVVLFFYPLDFTFVCPTEIIEFNNHAQEFEKLNAQLLGCSVDSVHSHKAWGKELGKLNFPLMSDMTREVIRDYGILVEDQGIALRGLYIIDPQKTLRYQVVHDLKVGRSAQETLRVLKALQTGQLCAASWAPGQKTLGEG